MPHKEVGILIDPPPSVPREKGVTPEATLAADPALDPPVVFLLSHGLRVVPVSGLYPISDLIANSVVVVFPIIAAPAFFIRSTAGASTFPMSVLDVTDPFVNFTSLTLILSFMEMGNP